MDLSDCLPSVARKVEIPAWIRGDVLDVRYAVLQSMNLDRQPTTKASPTDVRVFSC